MVRFIKNVSRCRYAIYVGLVQIRMPNLRSLIDVSGSGTSVNEQTNQSDMENVGYNFTFFYGAC